MSRFLLYIFSVAAALFALGSCSQPESENSTRLVFGEGAYPSVEEHNGTFYYTMQIGERLIKLHAARKLENIGKGDSVVVWTPGELSMHNFWSPEIHRINNKWYIYFEADNGVSTDNHQIYVLENSSDDPMKGTWTLHGPVITNSDWNFGIHPSTFVVKGRQYLVWSGWQRRRTEDETQCIFIAEMENPWTLKSDRVLISAPELEWERQWINPDGTRSAYPIFVNENPEGFLSPDGKKVIVVYSASGIWTPYNSLGMLSASADSDLLDPASWTKAKDPLFVADEDSGIFGTSNIDLVNVPNEGTYILYQAKEMHGNLPYSHVRIKPITWGEDGLPEFGKP